MDIHIHFNIELHLNQGTAAETMHCQPTASDMLLTRIERRIEELSQTKSHSTVENYKTAWRSLRRYLTDEVALQTVSHETMAGYERWLIQRGVALNTVSCYMRSLRSLLAPTGNDLFCRVFTGNEHTDKRSISTDALQRLRRLNLEAHPRLSLARDVFLFSFYAMGMPFVDVAHLLRAQVGAQTIIYYRKKTGRRVAVALLPVLRDIIERYEHCHPLLVFPLLGNDSYDAVLGRYNRALRRLGHMIDLDTPLTSYVVRHSWASAAYSANIDLPVISQALGHASTHTTLTYIREIDDRRLATASNTVARLLDD